MNTPSDHRIESTAWVPLMARALGPVTWPWLAPPDAQAQQVANGGGTAGVNVSDMAGADQWSVQIVRNVNRVTICSSLEFNGPRNVDHGHVGVTSVTTHRLPFQNQVIGAGMKS